ncbi:beta-lactamase/transpeptidase-like protein [Fusarium bulbicola]|nr:beta-lactamase/transpeptidase-like protein [Fusarium bulbicola]
MKPPEEDKSRSFLSLACLSSTDSLPTSYHCLFCHGYEEAGKPSAGVLALGENTTPAAAIAFARSAKQMTSKAVIYTSNNRTMQTAIADLLGERDTAITIDNREIATLALGDEGSGVTITFADGSSAQEAFLAHKSPTKLNGPFAEQLGVELAPSGDIKVTPPYGATSVKGVYAAGDCATPMKNVVEAMHMGTFAAKQLPFEFNSKSPEDTMAADMDSDAVRSRLKALYPVLDQIQENTRATMQDALSHNTGLAHMDLTWLGVECDYILDKEDLLGVVNHLPPVHDLRSGFHYNNYMYAVAGSVIEKQSGRPWHKLLRERILEPLAMHRTITKRAKLPDDNVAEPHVVLDDYSLHIQKPVDTAADNTLMGPAGGVWSNVSDMMKWAKALLDGIHDGPSVLKEVPTIVSHKSYITTYSIGENTYGLGLARAMIPSAELGMLSLNGPQREHIIGQMSRPRLVLYHNGGMSGYLTAFYLFPETKSAIVALGNSCGLEDGPDWSAQAIAQTNFDLRPPIDFAEVSKQRAMIEYERYARLAADFEDFRNKERREENQFDVNLEDYVGKYVHTGLKMALDIRHSTGESLTLVVNNVPSQHHQLTHFAGGKLGFLPSSREEFIIREFIDWFKWDQFILSFHRHEELGMVNGVAWALQNGIKPVYFERVFLEE